MQQGGVVVASGCEHDDGVPTLVTEVAPDLLTELLAGNAAVLGGREYGGGLRHDDLLSVRAICKSYTRAPESTSTGQECTRLCPFAQCGNRVCAPALTKAWPDARPSRRNAMSKTSPSQSIASALGATAMMGRTLAAAASPMAPRRHDSRDTVELSDDEKANNARRSSPRARR